MMRKGKKPLKRVTLTTTRGRGNKKVVKTKSTRGTKGRGRR